MALAAHSKTRRRPCDLTRLDLLLAILSPFVVPESWGLCVLGLSAPAGGRDASGCGPRRASGEPGESC